MNGVVNLFTTIPSAPGYVGTFDEPGIEILKAFGVDGNIAAAYTLVLLGLGLDELSMPSGAIPRIKRIVRNCTITESKALAEELVGLATIDDVEARVREAMVPKYLDEIATLQPWMSQPYGPGTQT